MKKRIALYSLTIVLLLSAATAIALPDRGLHTYYYYDDGRWAGESHRYCDGSKSFTGVVTVNKEIEIEQCPNF